MRVIVVNANSVKGKRAKIAELCNSTRPDVMVVTETKIDNTINAADFFPRNYQVAVRRDRSAQGGGVLIATKNGIVVDEVSLEASTCGEIACVRIAIAKSSPLYIVAYYRPPSDDTESLDSLQRAMGELADITKNSPKSTIIVAGDFNARDIDWDDFAPTRDCKKKGLCNRLINILVEGELHQLQRECTREDAILDLYCTNKPSFVKSIDTIPGISDNDGIILVDMCLKAQVNKKPQRKVPIWSKASWDAMKEDTESFSAKFIEDAASRSVEGNWSCLVDHIKVIHSNHIPTKLSSSCHNVPWLTGEVKKLCRKKRRLYKKAKKASAGQARKDAYKKVQNETRNALRKAHWSYVNSILLDGL